MVHQDPLSMGFFRQEYWSGLPFPPPGDLPDPAMELASPASPTLVDRFFTTEPNISFREDLVLMSSFQFCLSEAFFSLLQF